MFVTCYQMVNLIIVKSFYLFVSNYLQYIIKKNIVQFVSRKKENVLLEDFTDAYSFIDLFICLLILLS